MFFTFVQINWIAGRDYRQ